MGSERESKIYELYEIFNDYNRISILLNLYNEELTVQEIVKRTKLKHTIVFNNLEYLYQRKVLKKIEIANKVTYKISDKTLNKLIGKMTDYVKK